MSDLEEALDELLAEWSLNHDERCTNMPHKPGDRCHCHPPSTLTRFRSLLKLHTYGSHAPTLTSWLDHEDPSHER